MLVAVGAVVCVGVFVSVDGGVGVGVGSAVFVGVWVGVGVAVGICNSRPTSSLLILVSVAIIDGVAVEVRPLSTIFVAANVEVGVRFSVDVSSEESGAMAVGDASFVSSNRDSSTGGVAVTTCTSPPISPATGEDIGGGSCKSNSARFICRFR